MRRVCLVLWLFGSACAPSRAAPWVPSLVLSAGGSRGAAAESRGAAWRVEAAARWRLGRPRAIDEPPAVVKPPRARRSAPCADATLCAWERRARASALRRPR